MPFISRLKCKRCISNLQTQPPPEDSDCTSHLSQWYHCSNNKGLPDSTLSQAWQTSKCISFVFHHRSQGEIKAKIVSDEDEKHSQSLDKENNKFNKSNKFASDDEYSDEVDNDDSKDSDFE